MIDRIMGFVKSMNAPSESASKRDGILSHRGEAHASIIGLGVGVYSGWTGDITLAIAMIGLALGASKAVPMMVKVKPSEKVVKEVRKEPWYTIATVAIGHIVVSYGPKIVDAIGGLL